MKVILKHTLLLFCFTLLVNYVNGQSISNINVNGLNSNVHFCRGTSYTVTFDTTLTTGSTFQVQVSDSAGSFLTPMVTSVTNTSNSRTILIPTNAKISNFYKLKVRRISPATPVLEDSIINITITLPTPDFTFTNNICSQSSVAITNTSSGISPFTCLYNFGAMPGAPSNTTDCNPTVSFDAGFGLGTVTFPISLTVTDDYGCSNTVSKSINVKQRPEASIDTANNVSYNSSQGIFINCAASPSTPNFLLVLGNLSTNNDSSYNINWGDGSTNFNDTVFSFASHTYTTLGLFNITLTVLNNVGCTSQITYQLFNGNSPSGGLAPIGNVDDCVPYTVKWPVLKLGPSGTNQNASGTTYTFNPGDGTGTQSFTQSTLPDSITHTFTRTSCNGSSNVPFQINFTRTNPCTSSSNVPGSVSAAAKPTASFNITPDTIVCVNQAVTFSNTSIGNYINGSNCVTIFDKNWSISPATGWSVTSGFLAPTLPSAQFGSNSLVVNFTTPGIYTIKLRINKPNVSASSRCFTDSITRTICVQPIPVPNFNFTLNPTTGCVNNIVTVNNTSNTLLNCTAPRYLWTVWDSVTQTQLTLADNRYSFVSPTNDSSLSPIINFTQKGRYKLRLQIINRCIGTFIKDTLVIIKDKPIVNLPINMVYCDSQTIAFNPSNVNHNPNYDSSFGTINLYNWSIAPSGSSFVSGNNNSRNPSILFDNATNLPINYRVILSATNECGISQNDTQTITINPEPKVTATATNPSFCSGGTTNISLSNNLPSGVTYTWRAYRSSTNVTGFANQLTGVNGPIVQTLTNNGNTIETVTYKIAGTQNTTNCTGDSATVVITVYPIPRVIAASQSICSDVSSNVILSSNVPSSLYTWTAISVGANTTGFSNQITPIAGSISQVLTNLSTGRDTVKYTIRAIANGCSSTDTVISVIVNPIPSINNTILTQSICSGDTARFIPFSNVVGTTFSYVSSLQSGSATTGFVNGSGNILQRLFNTSNDSSLVRYHVTPTGIAPTFCVGNTIVFDVTVKPIPIASANPTSAFLCSGAQTNILLTSNVTGTLYTWTASLTSGSSTTGFSNNSTPTTGLIAQAITNTSNANSIVTYTITPIYNGCPGASFTSVITVYPGTTPGTLGNPATVCTGTNSGTLNLTGSTGSVLKWEFSLNPFTTWDSIANTTTSLTYNNLTQTTRYRAVVQSGTGGSCSQVATNFVQITVDSLTIAGNITGTDTVCTGTNSGNLTLNNNRGSIVNWQISNALPSWSNLSGTANLNPYVFNNLTQTSWYRVAVKNGVCPQIFSDSVRIQVDELPSNAVTTDKSVCATSLTLGINDVITANPITIGTGLWTHLSGPNVPTITKPDSIISSINNMFIGTHLIEWKVSNGKCPAKRDTLQFIVYPPLVSTISASQTICSGQSPLNLVGTLPTGGNGFYTYQWQNSLDGLTWNNISGANGINFQPPSLTTNTYYQRIVTSGNCVMPTNSVLITVLPLLTNSITNNSNICYGTSSPIIGNALATGGNGAYSYQWQLFNGTSWVNTSSADTFSDYNPGILLTTTLFRRLVNSGPCSSTSNVISITVFPLPIVNAGADSSKCQNQTTFFLNGTPNGGIWTGTGVIGGNSFNPSAMPLGNYNIIYTYTDANTCVNSDTSVLTVILPPNVNAGSDFEICENAPPIQINGALPTGGTWSGNGVSSSGLFSPTIAGVGTFYLKYSFTAGTGCSGIDSLLVTVRPRPNGTFVLPTQICPNNNLVLTTTTNPTATINGFGWTVSNSGAFSNSILSNNNAANPLASFPENKTATDVTYTIKLNTLTNFGCVDSATNTIILRRRPMAVFSNGSNKNCGPANYTMVNGTNNLPSSALSFLWSTTPNLGVNINVPSGTNPQISFPINLTSAAITYNINLIATRNDATLSCADTTLSPIIVYPKPIVDFLSNPNDSGCTPFSVNFINASDPQNTEAINTMSFLWNFGIYGSDTTISTSRTFTNSGTIDSTITAKLVGTSKWGCKDSISKTIKVFPNSKADFTSTIFASCAPFTINSSIITLNQYPAANSVYTWQVLDKTFNILSSSVGTVIPSNVIPLPNDTIYYRLITNSTRGCLPDTLTRMFRTISNPVPNFTMSDSVGCTPLTITFTNTSTAGVNSNWTFSNGQTSSLTNPTPARIFTNLSNTTNANHTAKLVITAGSGCKDSITKNIIVYPRPRAIFTLPTSACADTTKTATNGSLFKAPSATFAWQFMSTTNNTINNASATTPTFTFINNQTGIDTIYPIRLRVTSIDGCIHDTTRNITILKRPLAIFTVPTVSCGPTNVTISNPTTNSRFAWTSTPSLTFNTATSTNPIVTFPQNSGNTPISYRIRLTATRNSASCVDTTSRLVTIFPRPQAAYTSITQDSCGPRFVTFTNTSNAKNGEPITSLSYLWTINNVNSRQRDTVHFFTNTGVNNQTYSSRLIVTTIHGCRDTTTRTITVRPNARALFTPKLTVSCAPFIINSANITTTLYPNANSAYRWFANDNLIGISSTFPGFTLRNPNDSVLIKLVTISLNGCKDDSMQVWFKTIPNPVASYTMSDTIGCSPLSVNFINTSTTGVISNWTFSIPQTFSGTTPPTIIFNNTSNTLNRTFTAKLVVTAGTGCRDSVTRNILVYPRPRAIFALTSPACANSSRSTTSTSSFKAPTATYAWQFMNVTNNTISNATTSNPTFNFIDNQTGDDSLYTVKLTVTSVDGCVHDTTRNITILKRPTAIYTIPATFCGPANVTVNNTTVNSRFNWSSTPTLTFTTATSTNPVVRFPENIGNTSIDYRILLTATRNSTTCTDTTSRLVTIYPKPDASFTITNQDSCGPRFVNFTNTSDAKNGEPITSLKNLWTINNINSTQQDTTHYFTNTDTSNQVYNSRLIVTTLNGCKDTANNIITVRPDAKASFTSALTASCAPFNITSSNIQLINYTQANSAYQWYVNNNLIGITNTFPGYTIQNSNDSVLIKLVAISLNGCKNDSMEVWFKTIPNPVANFTMSDSIGCAPLNVNFTNTSTAGVISNWTFSNGQTSNTTTPSAIQFNNSSTLVNENYTAKLLITAGSGCKDSITKNILVYPKPQAIFSLPASACADTTKTAVNTSIFKMPSATYNWQFMSATNNTINGSNSLNPIFTFINNQTGIDSIYTVKLTVTSSDGCSHDTTQNITILKRPLATFTVPPTFCGPANVTISNTTINAEYVWNSSPSLPFNTATSINPSLSFPLNNSNTAIDYRIHLTATRTSSTCVDTTSRLVTIYPKPQASYNSITQDSCGPRFVNFINTSNPKNGEPITSLSNLWTINNINSTQKDTAHYFTNTGVIDSTFNTRLIVTTINGCKDTINNIITVKPDAKASFTVNNVTACAPFNITSSNIQLIEFAQANSAYEWYANNLFIGTGTLFPGYTISNQNDSVLIKLRAISSRGCKNDSLEVWFKTIENPKPNFTAIDSIACSPSNVTFNNTSTPATGLGYKWEFGNASNQSLQKNPLFTFNNFGLFDTTVTVKLVVTAGITGCKDSITKQIIIKPSPNPNFIMSDTFLCFPNKLFVTNTSANIPPYNLTSFKWKAIGPDSSSIENDTANTTTSISFMDNKTSFNKSYIIRLLIKSDFGCVDSLEKTVEITTRPIASFNFNIDSGCAPISVNTNNVSQNASTYTWFSTNTNVSVNNPSLTNTSILFPSHKGIIDSSYHISLVAKTAFGCLDTTSKSFKAFPLPISIFTMDKDSGCSPLDVNFTNNSVTKKPSSSFWNYGNGTSQIKNDSTFLNNFIGSVFRDTSYTIKLITTSKDGCKDSIQKQIKIKASAFAKIKLNDTLICSNPLNPTKLRIENNSYGSVDTFYWDFGDGNTLMTTSDSTINHPYTNEGVFKITLRAVNNCKTTFDSATIKIQIPPNVNFTLSDTVGCGPLSVAFSNTSTNIFEAKYLWDLGNGNNSSQFNPPNASYVQSRVSDSTYLVSLSIFNACGAFIKYDTVRVLPKPIALFATSTDSGCSPLPVFFINQSLGLPTTYKWYFGNGDSSSRFTPLQSPIVYRTIDSISYFTIKLITTNSCGIDSIERPIKVFPNTVKSFFTTSGNTICQNSFVSFTDQSTGGSNISWNLGDGNSSSARNPVNKYTKPGIFYAYQYVNNGCSFDTSFVIINVLASPVFNTTKSLPEACINSKIQFNSNFVDSGVITWNFGDGDSSNLFNPIHAYKTPGKYYINVYLKSFFNSCPSYTLDSIIISPLPQINLVIDTPQACLYKMFSFSANSPQTNIFNWNFGDSNTAIGTAVKHLYQNTGKYKVKVVAQTNFNCFDTASQEITVYPVPTADFSSDPKDTCRVPVSVRFNNLSSGAFSYAWSFGNGNTSNFVNPSTIYTKVGAFPVKLISSNQFNCSDTIESDYMIYNAPKAGLDFKLNSGCPPIVINFENTSTFGTKYLWYFGDGDTSSEVNPGHIYVKPGSYKVRLIANGGSNCADTIEANKTIKIFSKPNPSFSHVLIQDKKPYRTVVFSSQLDSVESYEWYYKGSLIGRGSSPSYRFADADSGSLEITLKTSSIDGCDSSITQTIELPSYWNGLFVPNAFTPTLGQGGANEFKPIGIELKYYSARVFNKWGELVWESTKLTPNGEPEFGWDGTDKKGIPCPQGTYIWVVEAEFTDGKAWKGMKLDDGNLHTKGNVSLIR